MRATRRKCETLTRYVNLASYIPNTEIVFQLMRSFLCIRRNDSYFQLKSVGAVAMIASLFSVCFPLKFLRKDSLA